MHRHSLTLYAVGDPKGAAYAYALHRAKDEMDRLEAFSYPLGLDRLYADLNRARFRRLWSPAPGCDGHIWTPGRLDESEPAPLLSVLRNHVSVLKEALPGLADLLGSVLECAEALNDETGLSPIGETVKQRLLQRPDEGPLPALPISVGVPERVLPAGLSELLDGVAWVPASDLRSIPPDAALHLLGPMWAWDAWRFAAPVHLSTTVIRPSWVRDDPPASHLFDLALHSCHGMGVAVGTHLFGDAAGSDGDVVLESPVRTGASVDRFIRDREARPARYKVLTYPVALTQHRMCFIPADGKVFVLDTSGDRVKVDRRPAHEVEPDQFILLRTRGAEDLVRTEADRLLGKRAAALRSAEHRWKAIVKRAIESAGVLETMGRLKLHGGSAVVEKPQNLLRWAHDDTLRPSAQEDLRAVLCLEGGEGDVDRVWSALTEIYGAHMRAGYAIQQQLHRQTEGMASAALLARDEQSFSVQGGGEVTAFRIRKRLDQRVEIDSDETHQLFHLPTSHDEFDAV